MGTRLLILAAALVLHLVGDYVLQRLLPLRKTTSFAHLLLHSTIADGPSFALIGLILWGYQGALAGLIVGAAAHCAVDVFQIRGSLYLKLVDQALHALGIVAYLVLAWH